jgi:hypothetical protein
VVCSEIRARSPQSRLAAVATGSPDEVAKAIQGCDLVIAAGAAGIVLLPKSVRTACTTLRVAIDLNAVPPLGIEGIEVGDKGSQRDGVVGFGALGVGDTKMKIHQAAVTALFARKDQLLDAEEVYDLALTI